ncbi:peptide chain release factor 3 [Facklamia miroungae]|uniref:Peptide chain release factor 3 n=1 Tax=Facklamia miroungae TaxID=120956 RepID=A0A1G7UJC3_9LACT|nr:peptide chain release factor 3 [Facklamia miroungae]NKZ30080.1 peptide chain release factor 3 [Facklamia miroungae]SDG47614.1 peptide chain release factor 3 [Facklamia miroungae]
MIKNIENEVQRRRTFAIISHPDAGKTTITEQLLLFSGAIREAGTVKAKGKKSNKFAKSDWMDIEKQRGISVTSSVMQVDYDGYQVNILDTPGHEDFSEDTYRTLMAVDAAVMVVDSGKGIEPQTKKLFEVVSKRGIPIFTFMNKLDRDGREPMDLVAELEEVLGIDAYPMNWPMGMGKTLLGLYDLYNKRVEIRRSDDEDYFIPLDEEGHAQGEHAFKSSSIYSQALDDAQLLHEAGNSFDREAISQGKLTPVFFGSALTGFGVQTFLDAFVDLSHEPAPALTVADEYIHPTDERFTGFIFKIQANMNPAHRDRIAFVRIVSGRFEKGMTVTLNRTGKTIRMAHTTQFMADSREEVQDAFAGDIIGLYDTGNFQIGDTIYAGNQSVQFEELPQFTPEIFMKVAPKNVMKQKSFHKGIEQLVQEGAIQLYKTYHTEEYILGAVGQLQFEVFQYRLLNEYNAEVEMTPMGSKIARWIDEEDLDPKMSSSRNLLAKDRFGQPVFLFENQFAENWFKDKHPEVRLKKLM